MTSSIEAWCLQYNQHLGKTLLLPVEEPKSILDQVINETIMRKVPEIHDRYVHVELHLFTQSNVLLLTCGTEGRPHQVLPVIIKW